jgi:hypothetical protein
MVKRQCATDATKARCGTRTNDTGRVAGAAGAGSRAPGTLGEQQRDPRDMSAPCAWMRHCGSSSARAKYDGQKPTAISGTSSVR